MSQEESKVLLVKGFVITEKSQLSLTTRRGCNDIAKLWIILISEMKPLKSTKAVSLKESRLQDKSVIRLIGRSERE